MAQALRALVQLQEQFFTKMTLQDNHIDLDKPGELGGLRAAKEREMWAGRVQSKPLEVADEWDKWAKDKARMEPGMPFSAKLFGDVTLKELYAAHSVLERAFLMQAEVQDWDSLYVSIPDYLRLQDCLADEVQEHIPEATQGMEHENKHGERS